MTRCGSIANLADLRELAGRTIVAGFPGDAASPEMLAALRDLGPGGIVLFERNVSTLAGTRALVAAASAAAGGPFPALVCIDQEGGRVARLRFRELGLPAMLALGAADDVALAERAGAALANDLRAVGANVDFAPVLDLALEPRSTVIGTRSFGDDPARVARLGAAVVRGLQSRGVAATVKHFPGHGATALDSHHEVPVVAAAEAELRGRDLLPFAAALVVGVRGVMTAHVLVPELDPKNPATLSPRILTGLLRGELRFDGVIFTDCLQMEAIAGGIGTVAGGVAALAAGADALLVSHDPALALALRDAVVAAVRAGELPLERLDAAVHRIDALRSELAGFRAASDAAYGDAPGDADGGLRGDAPGDADRDTGVSLEIATRAIALIRGRPHLDRARPVTVVSFEGEVRDGVARTGAQRPSLSLALRQRNYRSELMRVALEPEDSEIAMLVDVLRAQGRRALVVIARRAHLHAAQRRAIGALLAVAPEAIVVSALEPFDILAFEDATTVLCTFGDGEANVAALAEVLAGAAPAGGTLPVAVATTDGGRIRSEAEIDALLPSRGVRRPVSSDAPGDDAEAGGA
jgi:beta-N-acetylhexosaminidase